MSCSIEPTDKKEFGINVYKKLHELYGMKNHYEIPEIQNSLDILEYPSAWECWALVAFMLPANISEYLRTKGTPMNVLEMKREIVRAMTDGNRDSLNLPSKVRGEYDVEVSQLTQMNLVNLIAFYVGYRSGRELVHEIAGL